jgi:hypothetical protein
MFLVQGMYGHGTIARKVDKQYPFTSKFCEEGAWDGAE